MSFWDSSAIVPLCAYQQNTTAAKILSRNFSEKFVWRECVVEVSSAFARLQRQGLIESLTRQRFEGRLIRLETKWNTIDGQERITELARTFPSVHGLKAMDSLQLAAALVWCKELPKNKDFVSGRYPAFEGGGELRVYHSSYCIETETLFCQKSILRGEAMKTIAGTLLCVVMLAFGTFAQTKKAKTVYLADMTWQEAEEVLTPATIVVIPMGAQSKAHGPHLPLSTDFIQAEYFKERIAALYDVVIAPTVNYGFYPPFIEFPGSTTLGLSNAKGVTADICRSLSRYGVKRFYVINIGLSTNAALEPAVAELREEGILLKFTNLRTLNDLLKDSVKQEKGSHADEVETSIMLYIAPKAVDMKKADKDYGTQKGSGIWPTRSLNPKNPLYTIYNPSGTFGDATLANKVKGKFIVDTMMSLIGKDLEELKSAELPKINPANDRFKKFIGKYEIASGDVITISSEGGSLIGQRSGKQKMVFIVAGIDKFEIGRTELTFPSDSAGNVTHLLYMGDGITVLARKLD